MTQPDAERWMDHALALAARGAGSVSPNPLVGAVLVGPEAEGGGSPGALWGEGWHGQYGGPHAEVWAVRDAERRGFGSRLNEATLVVTLEPCSHTGKTPPCADLVLKRGIPRVVVAHPDPNPRVAGRGLQRLREAGVDVTVGVREAEARRLNEAFLKHVATGVPLVTLKLALSLDGSVATPSGDSRWVTGQAARSLVHRWRAQSDAVLVGAGTAATDDPALTVRHPAPTAGQVLKDAQPLRIVLDRTGALDPALKLFTDAHAAQTLAVVAESALPPYADALQGRGGTVLPVPEVEGHLDLEAVLQGLGAGEGLPEGRRVQSVLVEPGPGLATAFLKADLADRVFAFVAPKLVGGLRGVGSLGLDRMADALTFAEARWEIVGADALLRGFRRPV